MGTDKTALEEVVRDGSTGNDVTGSDRKYVLRMPGFFSRFISYYSNNASNMATGSDRRSLDPFGIPLGERMRNRKLRNILPVEWCAHVQTEVAQYLP